MIAGPPPTDTSESGANTSASVTSVFSSAGIGRLPAPGWRPKISEPDTDRRQAQHGRNHRETCHPDQDEGRCNDRQRRNRRGDTVVRPSAGADNVSADRKAHGDHQSDRGGGGAFENRMEDRRAGKSPVDEGKG